ncbi:MAG: hypothetical protein AB8B99_20075 [Phormidesmis sp.]
MSFITIDNFKRSLRIFDYSLINLFLNKDNSDEALMMNLMALPAINSPLA